MEVDLEKRVRDAERERRKGRMGIESLFFPSSKSHLLIKTGEKEM